MLNVEQAFDYMHQKSMDDVGVLEDQSEDERVLTDLLAGEGAQDEEERELESLDRQLSDIAGAFEGQGGGAGSGSVLDVGRLQELLGAGKSVISELSTARAAYQRAEYKMQLFMSQFRSGGSEKSSEEHFEAVEAEAVRLLASVSA